MIREWFSNWRFRDSRPVLEPGQVIEVYLTGFDTASGKGEARIGDSRLEVRDAAAEQVGERIRLRVESFDAASATGTACRTGS